MSLADLASIGNAVSGIAIVISLIYLNLQVRQSTKNQRAMMQQGRVARISSAASSFAEPQIADVYDRCWDGATDISTVELRQFSNICRQLYISAEDSFLQHKDSLLSESAYASLVASMKAYLSSPGMRAMWKLTHDWYEPGFAEFMDQLAQQVTVIPPGDRLARWKAAVTAEVGATAKSAS